MPRAAALLICLLAFAAPGLLAANAASAADNIDFYAGTHTGTYKHISDDLKHVLAEDAITLNTHSTDGSIDNIRQIATSKSASIGLVQADVLSFMRRSQNEDTKRFAERIRMVMPLYQEEVHILANRSITQFTDLKGKRVVVGEEGSGNMLTSVNLLAIADIRVGETMRLAPAQGVLAVLEGKADAVIYVSGKPVKLFKNIETLETADGEKFSALLDNVHFIPVSSPAILAEYDAATITQQDYSFVEADVPTVAVQAVLITGNYEDQAQRDACKKMTRMADSIRQHLSQLRKTGHPKWRDVNISKAVSPASLWKKDGCSWPKGT